MFSQGNEIKALLTAAEIGNLDTMKLIVQAAEEFEMKYTWIRQGDKKGRTTLHHACIYGYMNLITYLVMDVIESFEEAEDRSELLNMPDYKGRTPLFHGAIEMRTDVVRFLIKRGANIESITNERHVEPGSTLLMACAEKNSEECFEVLMGEGADILATREDGADATYIAARYGHVNIIEQLMENDNFELIANRPTFRGRTALLTAAFHGHIQVCKLLYEGGANLNHRDDNKCTALIYAANEGHFDVVKWLITNGASIKLKDIFGETASRSAEKNGHIEIIRILKIKKQDNDKDKEENGGEKEEDNVKVKTKWGTSLVPAATKLVPPKKKDEDNAVVKSKRGPSLDSAAAKLGAIKKFSKNPLTSLVPVAKKLVPTKKKEEDNAGVKSKRVASLDSSAVKLGAIKKFTKDPGGKRMSR